jgi:tetratricopeptide (TPR) repeat protein
MTASAKQLVACAPTKRTRHAAFQSIGRVDIEVSAHARRRGPYSGVGQVLEAVVPHADVRWPDLVHAHQLELLVAAPELARIVGAGPRSLVDTTPHEERTRYFGLHLIRAFSQGIISFLLEYARLIRPERIGPLTVLFDDVQGADPTTQEFIAILLRRADPAMLCLLIGTTGEPLEPELATSLEDHAVHVRVDEPISPLEQNRSEVELVQAYVASDGTSDDPAECRAYHAADPAERARLHDERAAVLERHADSSLRLGAIPYHHEHGTDPGGAGRRALREALEHCVARGYSAATVDFGRRGRAVCDPIAHQQDYCHFSAKMANALVPLGGIEESAAIYNELRWRYTLPQVHMTCGYGIAMLHTRFFEPRDHDTALAWANNSRVLAGMERDPIERAYFEVFQDNGIALIEMHRGNLQRALTLVTRGIDRLEHELPNDRYVVHRSQLLHNRARVLVALGRLDEGYADFTRLIEWDPFYVEYHSDRANLSRRLGDLSAALRDFDQAIAVSPPMPELHYNRASARAAAGLLAEALADLDYVLELEPDFADAHLTRGTLLLELGDAETSRADALAALRLDSSDPRAYTLLALSQQATGENERARASFDRALKVEPGYAPALVNRAVLACEQGDLDAALSDLTRALELRGDDADVLYNRGFVLQRAHRFTEAVRDFTRALALPDADRAELLARRAECLVALGDAATPDGDLVATHADDA